MLRPVSICQLCRYPQTFLVRLSSGQAMATYIRIASRDLEIAHDERREFFAQVRRNAGLEASSLAVVVPFYHLAHLVQPRDDPGLIEVGQVVERNYNGK